MIVRLPATVNLLRHGRALVVGELFVAVARRRRAQRLVSYGRHFAGALIKNLQHICVRTKNQLYSTYIE